MKTGISIYLSSPLQDIERTIERGAAAGARYAFTSLHIPEDGGAAYADKVRHVLSLLSARGIALIADVGPRTCDLLGLERIEDLRDLGLEYLRLDYGFSAQRVAELSGVFRIVVNASTVSSDEIASWREAGADVTRFAACHNFYPKPYTGLALEDIARTNLRLAALGFEIMAFVPGDANVRGPVFEGLPTVEAQRGRASKVALNMLELAHGADCDIVLVGDPDLSDAGWAQFAQVSAGYVDLQCELEPGYAYVRGQIHHDRPDSSVLIFRSQESRTKLKPDSVPTDAGAGLPRKAGSIAVSNSGYGRYEGELESGYAYVRGQIHHDRPDSSALVFRSQESRTTLKPDSVPTDTGAGLPRKAGSIAVSNSGYGRYEGELEIARVDLPGDERMNVAGHITPEAMELLPFIKRGFGVRFV